MRILGISPHAEPDKFLRNAKPSGHSGAESRVRTAVEHHLRRTDIDYQIVFSSSSKDYVLFRVSKISEDRYAVSQKSSCLVRYFLFTDEEKVKHQIEGIGDYCKSGENGFLRLDIDELDWGELVR